MVAETVPETSSAVVGNTDTDQTGAGRRVPMPLAAARAGAQFHKQG
jgi:hypothetical protein